MAASLVAQQDLALRSAQALVFACIAWLVYPRLRLRRTALFLAVTIFFNLLTPAGKVLVRVAGVAVTEGALMVGAGKAASLGGLLFLSRLMVDRRLRLPGTAGALIAATMTYLSRLMDTRTEFRLRNPVQSLDRVLEAVSGSNSDPDADHGEGITTSVGAACAVAVVALCGCAVVWGQVRG